MQKWLDLPPTIERPSDYEAVEKEIEEFLKKEIYLPILELFGFSKKILKNSMMDLVEAIHEGRVTYSYGWFSGTFSSAISKELKKIGATFARTHSSFFLPPGKLPVDVRTAIGQADDAFKVKMKDFKELIQKISESDRTIKLQKQYEVVIDKFNKNLIKNITIAPKLTDSTRERLAQEYTNNMQKFIKTWTEKEIVKLREKVEDRALKGFRYEGMISEIQKSYGVSRNKARFLARQETSLMITKLKQSRYQEAGVNHYRWKNVSASPKHPVRPMHKKLDGKIFSWDDPPVTDEKGNRNHPHEDYNCRCIAIPVVRI
jgi:SPP1 gp7 family putative phage head morphogenesis protein